MVEKNGGKKDGDLMLRKKKFRFLITEQGDLGPTPDCKLYPDLHGPCPRDLHPAVRDVIDPNLADEQEEYLKSLKSPKRLGRPKPVKLKPPTSKETKYIVLAGNSHMQGYERSIRKHYGELKKQNPHLNLKFIPIRKPYGSGGKLSKQELAIKKINQDNPGKIAAIIHGGSPSPNNVKWKTELESLLKKYKAITPNLTFIGSPSPRYDEKGNPSIGPKREEKRYRINQKIKSILKKGGVKYIDVYDPSRDYLFWKDYGPTNLGKVHPLQTGYNKIYKQTVRDNIKFDFKSSRKALKVKVSKHLERQYKKSLEYDDIFKRAAKKYDVDVNTLKALTSIESAYNPRARSNANAIGLMQLLPTTAKKSAKQLKNPETNIMSGAKHYGHIQNLAKKDFKKMKPELIKYVALMYYNFGRGGAQKYLRRRGILKDLPKLEAELQKAADSPQHWKTTKKGIRKNYWYLNKFKKRYSYFQSKR